MNLADEVRNLQEQLSECVSPICIDGSEWMEKIGDTQVPLMRGSPRLKEFIAYLHQSAHDLQERLVTVKADRDKWKERCRELSLECDPAAACDP